MSSVSDKSSVLLPVCLIIIAMISVQSGASLAKLLFPLVGAEGATSLRLGFGTLVLALVYKPWRTPMTPGSILPLLVYGLVLGGMNFLFYQSIKTLPLGIAVALDALSENPMIGRGLHEDPRELVIGRDTRGYMAMYRYSSALDSVFVMGIRAQREAGYARGLGDNP